MTPRLLQQLEAFLFEQRKGSLIHLDLRVAAADRWEVNLYRERGGRQRVFTGTGASGETALEDCLQRIQRIYPPHPLREAWYRLRLRPGLSGRLAVWRALEERLPALGQCVVSYYYKEHKASRWQARHDPQHVSRGASAVEAIRRLLDTPRPTD